MKITTNPIPPQAPNSLQMSFHYATFKYYNPIVTFKNTLPQHRLKTKQSKPLSTKRAGAARLRTTLGFRQQKRPRRGRCPPSFQESFRRLQTALIGKCDQVIRNSEVESLHGPFTPVNDCCQLPLEVYKSGH